MSKRDMRAKKLLLAVLLAMSMQSYYAAPTWAAETGQPAGQTETVDGKGQSDGTTTPAADEAETVKKIDTKQEVDEALTIMGYSVNTLNADEDAGIMPAIVAPGGNPSTNAYTAGDASVSGSNLAVAIGYGANATSADGSVVLGASGEATAKNAVALGYNAKASHENSVAIGANSTTTAVDQVSFGKYDGLDEYNLPVWAVARSLVGIKDIDINGINFEGNIHDENVIIGGYMDVPSKYSTLVGYDSITNSDYGVAIGKRARVHTSAIYSVALGAESFVDEDYTVSFGNDDGMSRKLIGVNGIEFADNNGYLIGVTYINGVTVSDPYSFNDGLTFGGNATIGKANTPFSSNKFSVNDTGAITAASLSSTGAIIANSFTDGKATLTGGKLTGVTGINSTGAITTASLSSTGAITAASGTIGGITLNGGALDKVSSINGADFTINSGGIAVGYGTSVGEYGIAFGSSAHARGDGIALGRGVDADGPSSIALGFNMTASGAYSISIGGDDTYSDANKSIAIGTGAEIDSNPAGDENIGSIAFGFYANASHENSVAIGMGSNATDDNQVNLGYYKLKGNYPDTSSTYYGRSLAGISSIDFIAGEDGNKGVITGLSSINGVAVSGSAADGLTFGGNAIIGKTDIPFSSTGFSVDKVGALTASSGTIGGITLNGGALDKVTSINDANLDMNHGIGFGWEAYIYGSGAIAIGDEALSGDDSVGLAYGGTVAIGTASAARKNYSTAIGANTEAGEERGTALGYMAYADKVNSVAIGTASKTFNNNEVNFGYYTLDRGSTNESGPYYGRSLAGISSIDFIAGEDGTKGAITGVTSINGMNFVYDGDNSNIILGANVKKDVGNTIALGVGATASGPISMALGNNASATAQEATVIGADASVFGEESVGVGSNSTNSAGQTVVIGVSAGVYETAYTNSTVIGYSARSSAPNGIALGANAEVKHENSVAIGTESITTAVNQVSFGHKQDDLNAGGGYFGDDLFRSVVNVADIEMHGGITGLTSIEGVAVSGSADAGLTVSGVTLNGGAVNGVTLGLKGGDTDQDNVLVGGIDLTALSQSSGGNTGDITALKTKTEGIERTGDGSSTPYATTIEGVTLNSNKVTASGGIVVDSNNQLDAAGLKASKVNGATITSNTFNEVLLAKDADNSHYKVGDVDVTALSRTVGDATKGLVKDTADLKTAVGDADTGLAAVNTKVGTNIAAITAINERTTGIDVNSDSSSKFSNGFTVGSTSFGMSSDGALTAKTINTVTIEKVGDAIKVGDIDLTALSQSSGGNTGDITALKTKTEGIERTGDGSSTPYATTIEGVTLNSNKVTASGGIVVDSNNQLDAAGLKASKVNGATITSNTFNEVLLAKDADNSHYKVGDVDVTALSRTVGDATKGLVKDTADLKTAVGDADTGLAAVNTKVTDLQTATTGMSYDSGTTSTSFSGNVVVGNVGNQTHTQITDNAIIFGQGAEKQVTVDASGIHVGAKAMNGISTFADSNGTHIDHTSLVTDTVTAANLNGVAISGNATDGLSVGGVNIKTLDDRLATLKTTVDDIQNSGVGTADMAGVQRSDADGDGINDTTTIETATSFTANGMKTSNLEVLTAAIGGVDFAANGVMTNVGSINGISFADGKIGGVSLSGGKVNGVDVVWLDKRVTTLEKNGSTGGGTGGGGGANTSGITKPDGDNTVIEGNTNINSDGITTNKVTASDQIIVADGKDNQTVISEDGIKVAAGKTNEVTINDKGIHVGKNSSVMNDTEGFITDKGLYIGVNSSNDISTAKFSVDKGNGTMTSKVGGYTFTNGSSGAVFSHSGDTAVTPGGSFTETTIKGNKVTTGRLDADELYVDGNKVNIAGGTIGQTDAVANHLEGTDGDGNKVTNDFKTSALNGTTQAAEQTSADGKKIIKTENNTSAGGTSVTTSKTSINSADRKTEQSSSFVTNESGMSLNTSTKVTDKDGNVTKNTSGETKMSGDSLTVSKKTVTTKDGKTETKTSSTEIGSGEVTLHREDGSTIRVGEAIEGMQGQIQDIGSKVNKMGVEIKEVGALSAALAGLHPQPENANSRADFAMAMGSYEGKQALAVGGFYRPDKRTMLSIGASTTSSKHMMNMGISIALDRLPEEERKAQEAAAADPETLNKVLERLAALEQDNQRLQADNKKRDIAYEKLAADYTQLKEKYTEKTAEKQQAESKLEEAAPAEADSSSGE